MSLKQKRGVLWSPQVSFPILNSIVSPPHVHLVSKEPHLSGQLFILQWHTMDQQKWLNCSAPFANVPEAHRKQEEFNQGSSLCHSSETFHAVAGELG